jgi:hypothetical protein
MKLTLPDGTIVDVPEDFEERMAAGESPEYAMQSIYHSVLSRLPSEHPLSAAFQSMDADAVASFVKAETTVKLAGTLAAEILNYSGSCEQLVGEIVTVLSAKSPDAAQLIISYLRHKRIG